MTQTITDKILCKREQYFAYTDTLSEREREILAERWHKIINRYQKWVCKAYIRRSQQVAVETC